VYEVTYVNDTNFPVPAHQTNDPSDVGPHCYDSQGMTGLQITFIMRRE